MTASAAKVVGDLQQFLTFRLDDGRYAVPVSDVAEVMRMPSVARVPLSPRGLLGLANLRGSVVPVASGRGLLGQAAADLSDRARVIVLEGAPQVALAVDAIDALAGVAIDVIETRPLEDAELPGEMLKGAFITDGGSVKILDLPALIAAAFTARSRKSSGAGRAAQSLQGIAAEDFRKLVTFAIAGQEYALDLVNVQEVIAAPDASTAIPDADGAVHGVIGFRGGVLPILSLRYLLGFPQAEPGRSEKIIVTKIGDGVVGLISDRMTGIVSAAPSQIEDLPEILAARAGGESRIRSIYRGTGGKRLIPILNTEELCGEAVMRKLEMTRRSIVPEAPVEAPVNTSSFLAFRLGKEEFGFPMAAVEEVVRLPDQITRIPKAPKFLEGVINLRGAVLPIVDQRRRFGLRERERPTDPRLIVVRTPRHRAGLIVDSVSDVLRVRDEEIGLAPKLPGERNPQVNSVANVERLGRFVLLLDPGEVLSRAEQDSLDKFVSTTSEHADK